MESTFNPLPFGADFHVRRARHISHLILCVFAGYLCIFSSLNCWSQTPLLLVKCLHPVEQRVPLIMNQPNTDTMKLSWVKLRWDNMASAGTGTEGLRFEFDKQGEDVLFDSFRSQLWISALASAMAWQQPWISSKWTVTDIPEGDASGNEAALAIAMIATAGNAAFPSDTIVLGRLNPDGSLGLVGHLAARVEAASAAGIKRVVIPNLERSEVTSKGEVINIPSLALKLGMECVLADDLVEATEIVLRRKLPPALSMPNSPRYSNLLFVALEAKCRVDGEQLRTESAAWPLLNSQLSMYKPSEQLLWRKIFQAYYLGLDAFRAGQPYVAYKLMRQSHSDLSGMAESKRSEEHFDRAAFDERANKVRKQIVARMTRPSIDKNELQSALVLAEESDWLYKLNASVEGAQIIAHQAFDVRSDSTPQQKLLAQTMLVDAVEGAEFLMADRSFYQDTYPLLVSKAEVPVYNRAAIMLPQLLPAELGRAELFTLGLKSRAHSLGESLVFDPRVSTFARALGDAQLEWEQQKRETAIVEVKEQPKTEKVGFTPGTAYSPPKPPPAPVAPVSLSDAARCLILANQYCEVAMLDQKYLYLGGSFDTNTLEWNVSNRLALQNMLQFAEIGARRGILLAESIGVDTSTLALIYETASNLRASEDNNIRLEGLRQYWRCAMLGNMCWQLGYAPPASMYIPEVEPQPRAPVARATVSTSADSIITLRDALHVRETP
jgi:hypothetical protein